jgi:SPP1 gp7 family putative phage head morphogenesis protein
VPPAPQAQPPQPQQPGQQQAPPPDSHLIALVVSALAAYGTAKALSAALRAPFKAAGISAAALSAVAALAVSWPREAMKGTGPAQRWTVRANLARRASYFLAATRRVHAAVVTARSQGEPAIGAVRDALATEKRFMSQHVAASAQRVAAASAVDRMAAKHGNLLGWQAILDPRCSPGCAKASGKNFRADRPPVVEGHQAYPGSAHPNCRCRAVAPFKGADVLP